MPQEGISYVWLDHFQGHRHPAKTHCGLQLAAAAIVQHGNLKKCIWKYN